MDRKALARKLREALFDHIEAGRRDALQDGAVDALFERVLATWGKPSSTEVDLISPEELCRTWTTPSLEISTVTVPCVYGGHLVNADTPSPVVGDVDLNTASVYAYKDGIAQWVSIRDPMFDAVITVARS